MHSGSLPLPPIRVMDAAFFGHWAITCESLDENVGNFNPNRPIQKQIIKTKIEQNRYSATRDIAKIYQKMYVIFKQFKLLLFLSGFNNCFSIRLQI